MGVADEVAQLFRDWHRNSDQHAREELVKRYLHVAEYVAKTLNRNLTNVELDDLITYAQLGLLDAIDKFDLDRDVKFETYAVPRIRGAVIDAIRSLDWVPRSVRYQVRQVDKAIEELSHITDRAPDDTEIADYLGMRPEEVSQARFDAYSSQITSYDQPVATDEGASPLKDLIGTDHSQVDALIETTRLQTAMVEAIQRLDQRGKVMVALYYFQGVTLADIGLVYGVTESRVCQIHTKVLQDLASGLDLPLGT